MIIEIFRNGDSAYNTPKLIEIIKERLIDNGKKYIQMDCQMNVMKCRLENFYIELDL